MPHKCQLGKVFKNLNKKMTYYNSFKIFKYEKYSCIKIFQGKNKCCRGEIPIFVWPEALTKSWKRNLSVKGGWSQGEGGKMLVDKSCWEI